MGKKGCETVALQSDKTIRLYEAWWRAPSLRSARGIQPERCTGNKVVDTLVDSFMQTREGTLLHEVSFLHPEDYLDADSAIPDRPFSKQRTDEGAVVSRLSVGKASIGFVARERPGP